MATKYDMVGLLSSVLPEALDSPCTEDHLKKLGLKLPDWRVVAMLLGLDDKIRDIQQEGESTVERAITMLVRWRQSRGEQATYRCLAGVLGDIGRIDLVEMICELVGALPAPSALALAQNQSTTLQKYANHLRSLYRVHQPAAIVQTLPPPTDKYFNLVLIKKKKTEPPPNEEVVHSIVQEGNISQVLKTKVGIKLDDIFKADEAARKMILIEGAPGSGKTTLSWQICQKWASGELFQQFSLAVLVQLRDPAIQSASAITDLLNFPCAGDKLAQEAMSEIQSRGGEGVLFVMDGWDELVPGIQQNSVIQQLIQPSLTNPLPNSAVIITSRSESVGQLQEVASSRIETMGFTPSDVKEYFAECLKGDSQAVEKLSEAVQQNPQIEASCYLPLNAAIIVAMFLMTPTSRLPATLHELFTMLVLTCLLHHLQKRKKCKVQSLASLDALPGTIQSSFDHLCQIAFNGIKRNKLSFSAEEVGVHSEFDTLSLLQGVQSFQFGLSIGVSKAYSFLHLSVQELLAARHISVKLSPDEQARLFHELIDHPRFTAVFRFFAGVTQLKGERIAKLFLKLGESNEWNIRAQYKIPLDVLQERYQYMYLTQPSPEWDRFKLYTLCHVDTRLLLFNCLYEARNPSLYKSLATICGNKHRKPPLLHLGSTPMSAFDYLSLGYFLPWVCHAVNSEISVHLELFHDTCMKFLVKGLTEGIREAKSYGRGIIGSLYIELCYSTWKHEDLDYVTQLLQLSEGICISGLKLSVLEWYLPSVYTSLALGKVLQKNATLKTFSVSIQGISEIVTDIAKGLKHNGVLETVEIGGFISDMGVKSLADVISCNKQLKTLIVFGEYGVLSTDYFVLIEALKHNSTLRNFHLRKFIPTAQGLELLANALTVNTTLEILEYEPVEFMSKTELSALAKRLWASGVLHQLLTIIIRKMVEWFGEEETIKALQRILLEWTQENITFTF